MKKTMIVINSSGRPDKVKTIEQFPKSWKKFTRIVVPNDQASQYREHTDYEVVKLPKKVPPYLSSQRQWVMENILAENIWMMDDDLTFMKRNAEMRLKSIAKSKDMEAMKNAMELHLESIPIVGISTRLGNNRVTEDYADITRVTRCYAVNVATFNLVGQSFAPFEPFCMQDFHMNLCFLERGYPNRVLYTFAQGDSGSNSKGGCSSYRTGKVLARVAGWMEENHPGCVTVKQKKTKTGWEGEGFEKDADGYTIRTDVVVHWKKAYKPKRNKSGGLNAFL